MNFLKWLSREMSKRATQMEIEHNTKMNKDWYPLTNYEVTESLFCIMHCNVKDKKI